jgi:hypothetical protein
VPRPDALTSVGFETDAADFAAASDDAGDDTDFWMFTPDIREPLVEVHAGGRRDGEDEVRAQEAAAVAEAALGLAGHEVHPSTRELIAAMGRGRLTGDEAVAVIVARFVDGSLRHRSPRH